jgi:hypothetical protein
MRWSLAVVVLLLSACGPDQGVLTRCSGSHEHHPGAVYVVEYELVRWADATAQVNCVVTYRGERHSSEGYRTGVGDPVQGICRVSWDVHDLNNGGVWVIAPPDVTYVDTYTQSEDPPTTVTGPMPLYTGTVTCS